MKSRLGILTSLALLVSCGTGQADVVNNLTFTILGDGAVSQSQSNPCVICATQAQNPTGFGFNNFDSTGNDSSFNLFSSAVTGSFGDGDDINVTPYLRSFLAAFLIGQLDVNLTFGLAIDINTAKGGETLQSLQLIDLDAPIGSKVIFDLTGPIAMPDQNNGNGFADYLITGFDLSNVGLNDRLLFRASWTGATDGGESFYIVPILQAAETPLPAAVWMFGGVLGLAGMVAGHRRRKQRSIWDETKTT